MSDFDKDNIRAIIRFDEPHYDWFTAFLLRAIFRAPEAYDQVFAEGFPDEYDAVHLLRAEPDNWNAPARFSEEEFIASIYFLLGKADGGNQLRLMRCFPQQSLQWAEWIVSGTSEQEFEDYWRSVGQ